MSAAPAAGKIDEGLVRTLAEERAAMPGALLPILHEVQRRFGYVPDSAIGIIAKTLNLSRAEVHGVVTFYHWFRREPRGRHVLYVCRAEACQAMGGRQLEQYVKDTLKVDFHETTADGRFSLEPIYCLGNCACSPAVMIDEDVHGRVTPEKLDELIA